MALLLLPALGLLLGRRPPAIRNSTRKAENGVSSLDGAEDERAKGSPLPGTDRPVSLVEEEEAAIVGGRATAIDGRRCSDCGFAVNGDEEEEPPSLLSDGVALGVGGGGGGTVVDVLGGGNATGEMLRVRSMGGPTSRLLAGGGAGSGDAPRFS